MSIHRNVFASDEVADLVFKVIGEIEPVGETHTDDERFCHLQNLLNVLDILIDEVVFVLPCEERYEYSMKRAGQEVRRWIEDKNRQFAYNLDEEEDQEGAQPEIIRCKDCKHRPVDGEDTQGFGVEFPDYICPCQCDDGFYNWRPNDEWYCANAERGTDG